VLNERVDLDGDHLSERAPPPAPATSCPAGAQ
jgi:hypothetical protein